MYVDIQGKLQFMRNILISNNKFNSHKISLYIIKASIL